MSDDAISKDSTAIIFDGWRSISFSLFKALVGYTVMVSVPVLSTAAVEMLGFTEEQVGRVWGADLELHLLPQLSMNQIYLFFIATSAVCLLFLHWLPARPLNAKELAQQEKHEDHVENWHVPRFMPVIYLVAVCFTYINIGGYFTYMHKRPSAHMVHP